MLSSNQNAQRLTLNIQRSTKIVILSRAKDLSIEAKIIHGMCVVRDASVRSLTSFGTTGAVRRWALNVCFFERRKAWINKFNPGLLKNYPADAV
jgi:hypothetical protein